MDKIKAFKNAKEFNEIFGIVERDNGTRSRRNLILLSFYKSKSMWSYCRKYDLHWLFFSIRDMARLKSTIIDRIRKEMYDNSRKFTYRVLLNEKEFWSGVFETDRCNGVPSNGDVGFVRYITHETNRDGKIYKMRAGRFYKRLLLETELGQALPQQVLNWLCEEFAKEWASYITRLLPKFTLRVDDNFQRIYSYGGVDGCTHEFGSCMMDDNQHHFYEDCIECKAASLVNENGMIIARCIIYTNVIDETGKVWRLAERQYSEYSSDLLKQCLVDALLEGDYIDGYKQVGVDCHCCRAFVDKDGNSLSHHTFHIENKLEFSESYDDAWNSVDGCRILSYQDSFKYYDYVEHKAYNRYPDSPNNIFELDTTESYLQGIKDEYHGGWCVDWNWVWYQGREIRCDRNRMEDFVCFNTYFIHKSDMTDVCPICGRKMPRKDLYGTKGIVYQFEDEYFCKSQCRDVYVAERCFYDDTRGCFVSKKNDSMVKILHLAFGKVSAVRMCKSKLEDYISRGKIKIVRCDEVCNGAAIAFYSDGMLLPIKRFSTYLNNHTEQLLPVAMIVANENAINGVQDAIEELAVDIQVGLYSE